MTGQNKPLTTDSWSSDEQQSFAESLNDFYCRFERSDVASDLDNTIMDLKGRISEQVENSITLNEEDVKKAFLKLNARKAAGPDHISGKLLKSCANSLSCIFSILFNWSLNDCFIPTIWKHSIIRPIPKNNKPSCTNDYRPVALTSIVMKCFERIILSNLRPVVEPAVDRFQFAYKTARGTDDATMTLLHKVHSHLDSASLNFVRILFIDFSSAFNTIQPHLLANKLLHFSVEPSLVLWIVRFLVDRTQNVVFQSSMSSLRRTSTGAPQGTVLSPFLFTMYTDDCRGSLTCPLIKFSDDSALIDLSNDDSLYFSQVSKFVQWCKDNYLLLNVKKTKELVIDFRKDNDVTVPLIISDETVERVENYKYLGTVIDNKLAFDSNTVIINKKCQSRIYLLQKLRNLNVNKSVMQMFYRCFIESVLTFSFLAWYGSLNVKNKNVLERVVKVCSKIVGVNLKSLNVLFESRALKKGRKIANDCDHILSEEFDLLPSGKRYRVPKARTLRLKNSFVPRAIALCNSSGRR